ncbi:MAG: peptidoglycan DL-endopeptidase CwlO [Pseudonocardiales bacterium]|nr:peptidoglycan DL-endopeptidase CwlO [Pseudonocardiales bacterium]
MPRPRTAWLSALCVSALAAIACVALVAVASTSTAAVSAHNPRGSADSMTLNGAVVSFNGWVADPDLSGTVRVVVTLDRTVVRSTLANHTRLDVARAFPSYGSLRGFSGAIRLPSGGHTVCLIAGDLGLGSDTTLKCAAFTVRVASGPAAVSVAASNKAFGDVNGFSYSPTARTLSVNGWALDPDTSSPVYVDVIVDGQSFGSAVASRPRPDVAQKYPRHGPNHGFAYTMKAAIGPGNYRLCAVAINAGAGGNTILPCKVLTVRPVGTPAALNVATNATAAAAIQAQAIRSGAARASSFPVGANSATRIAIAARALLQQAAGRATRPPAVTGIPAFAVASPSRVVDEQAVMGPRPTLGSYPAVAKGGRTGSSRSLQLYANDGLPTPGGAGDGIFGAAPLLAANGTTVHPSLPGYGVGYSRLRAEVALDAALAHIGDPYVWAAAGPGTFDCSGLTQWAWAKAGVSLAHYTGTQAVQGVRVQPNQLLPGDLVLFGGNLHHVGMYLGAGYMLDAPNTGAYVRVDKISWFGDFSLAVRP